MRRIFWLSIVIFWVILTILPLSAYAAVDKDTVAVWLFDEGAGDTVRDFSGNGHDGKLMGDPKWTGAEHGKGLDFEGDIANYVEVPHSDDLNLEQWTIEGWFLVRSVIGGWDCPFAKETADPIVRNYALHLEGGTGILHGITWRPLTMAINARSI